MDLIAGFLISPLSYKYEPIELRLVREWNEEWLQIKKKNPDIYKFL